MQKNFTLKRIVCLLAALCLAAGLVGCADMPASSSEESSLPTILVGSDVYPPFNYIGEDGAPTGIDVELAKEAFRRMGYRAEFTIIDWERKTQLLETGDIDCVWGSFTINGREDDYRWAGPYMASRQVVAVMPGSDIETIADLEGPKQMQYVLRERSAKCLADAIRRLMEHPEDFAALSEENLKQIQKWDWPLMTQNFKRYFDRCLAKKEEP